MWYEDVDNSILAEFSQSTFWFVLVTLPMFLLIPQIIDRFGFWISIGLGSLLTIILYTIVSKII